MPGLLVQDLYIAIWLRFEVGFIEMMDPDKTVFSAGSVACAGWGYSNTIRMQMYSQQVLR